MLRIFGIGRLVFIVDNVYSQKYWGATLDRRANTNDGVLDLPEGAFRKLFDLNPLPMWLFDVSTLGFLAVNEAAVGHYGYSLSEFLNMTLLDIRPTHEVTRFEQFFQSAMETPEMVRYSGEWFHRCKDGSVIHCEVTSHRFPFEGREAVLSVINDITEKKKAEQLLRESEDRFRMLSEAAAEAIVIHQDFRIMEVNNSFLKLFGAQSHGEVIGKNPLDFVPEEHKAYCLKKILEGIDDPYELELKRLDGSRLFVQVHARSIRYRDGVARVVAVHDITERKKQEDRLIEREARLAASNRELEQFAYVTSHDLQEPLRMVASYVALLEKSFIDVVDPKAKDYVRFAVLGAKRMKQLIDDLLSFSTIGKKEFAPRTISLSEVLRGVLSDLRLLIEETGATVTYDPLPQVLGDASQLGQVFANLISNALKFRSDAPPVVRVSAYQSENGEPVIVVSDQGIGIEMQYAERIFRIFQRLHTADEYPGTGIGLAICQKIIERHGGKIWVNSQPSAGSSFHFSLRAAQSRCESVKAVSLSFELNA